MGYGYARQHNRIPADKHRYWSSNDQEYVYVANGFFKPRNIVMLFPMTMLNITTINVVYLFSLYYIIAFKKWNSLILCTSLIYVITLCYWIGVHRMWSHKAFKAHWTVRVVLAIAYTATSQGTIFDWCRGHRVHNKHSDTDADPHNIRRGVFFVHYAFLFTSEHPDVQRAESKYTYDDFRSDWVVGWQERNYLWLEPLLNYVLIPCLHYFICGDNLIECFLYFCLRLAITSNSTDFINSAAHLFGDRPYNPNIRPSENLFVSLMTMGEGYHNFHHQYPFDYRQSEMSTVGLNFSALLIDFLGWLGLVWDRRTAPRSAFTKLNNSNIIDYNNNCKNVQ